MVMFYCHCGTADIKDCTAKARASMLSADLVRVIRSQPHAGANSIIPSLEEGSGKRCSSVPHGFTVTEPHEPGFSI